MDVRATAVEALTELIRREMGATPEPGEHVIRCAPGTVPFRLPANVRRRSASAPVPIPDAEPDTRATPSDPGEGRANGGEYVVEGVASSTSVDWYGTEMSARALDDMANQFNAGVDLFPRHGGFLDTVEWDEVIGRTFASTIQRADVADPADPSETGFILSVQAKVERNAPRADELERRLDADQPIGLSIGGWFLEVRYITSDEGEIERIIVERVALDHVAVVRSPANPDAVGLKVLRDAGRAAVLRSAGSEPRVRTVADAVGDLQARHVIKVTEEDDAIVLRIAKGHGSDDGDDTDDGEGDDEDGDRSARSADNPGGVTACDPVDSNTSARDDARDGSTGDSPDTRSTKMDKMDEILAKLGEVAEGQRSIVDRVSALEARATDAKADDGGKPGVEITTLDPEAEADRIARSVLAKLEERGIGGATPTPTPDADDKADGEAAELRARIAALEAERDNRDAALANLVDAGRVGRSAGGMKVPQLGPNDGEQAARDIGFLIERCKQGGDTAPVLCAVVNRHKDAISISREASGALPRGERGKQYLQAAHNAPTTLRSLLIAAERDGLIGDLDHGWRR